MTDKEKKAAVCYLSTLLEKAYEDGAMPQPSEFGIDGKDDDTGSNMYDLCNDLLCSIKIED